MEPGYTMPHMGGETIANKLTARLMEELRKGEFSEAERLPSEVELAAKYKVSRSVIRDVLSNLERECLVERVRGLGTIIHRDVVEFSHRLDLKSEYYDLIQATGARPGVDQVKLYEKEADAQLAGRLGLKPGTPLIVCEKRILADGVPVIYSIDSLAKHLFTKVDWKMLDWSTPVFDLLEQYCGIVVDTDIAGIQAVMGEEKIRKAMELKPDQLLLMMDELGCYKLTRPIFHTHAYYTSFFDFTILRRKF